MGAVRGSNSKTEAMKSACVCMMAQHKKDRGVEITSPASRGRNRRLLEVFVYSATNLEMAV